MNGNSELAESSINTLRFLAADAVQRAESGHPGTPMGAAPLAYELWQGYLKHNPKNPAWPDRDRFVLSPGHASMLLYGLLHLCGYDVTIDDLRSFRQWGSNTPGHPEYGETPGVEVTTGPLGQGFGNAVGMAIAERWLAEHYNRPGFDIIKHYTYVLASDGDMQEGVTSEAASLAGFLRLGKLICLYDDNDVQIEGSTDLAFSEDVEKRFEAYGWHVLGPVDGLDLEAIGSALESARDEVDRPTLIICKTVIGFASPKQGTAEVHGEPLGPEGVTAAKKKLGWPLEPAFHVPEEVREHMGEAASRGQELENAWRERLDAYGEEFPDEAAQLRLELEGKLPADWDAGLAGLFPAGSPPMATREASGQALNALVENLHALVGGSADLAPSTKTELAGYGSFGLDGYSAHNLHFGVREHAMGAILSGLALHGGPIPYGGTFLQFTDYMRAPMRLAALMGIRVIYVLTHDSIGLGEDGPTHQPVEHLPSLRAVPNLVVIRPADARETAEAWRAAVLRTEGPTALVLTRQKVPHLTDHDGGQASNLQRGAYVFWESGEGVPDVILIGSGSELQLALQAGRELAKDQVAVRVVSMPSWELYEEQPDEYKENVLPSSLRARVAVEAACPLGWERYVGLDGEVVGVEDFGASAPGEVMLDKYGITTEAVIEAARRVTARSEPS